MIIKEKRTYYIIPRNLYTPLITYKKHPPKKTYIKTSISNCHKTTNYLLELYYKPTTIHSLNNKKNNNNQIS